MMRCGQESTVAISYVDGGSGETRNHFLFESIGIDHCLQQSCHIRSQIRILNELPLKRQKTIKRIHLIQNLSEMRFRCLAEGHAHDLCHAPGRRKNGPLFWSIIEPLF